MPIEIRLVRTRAEFEAVCRLRYEVYIAEQERAQGCANHRERRIEEPLDETALLWIATEGSEPLGTVRVNYASRGHLGIYEDLYRMRDVGPDHPGRTCITTKLVVAPSHRNSSLAYRLAASAYRQALGDGLLHDYIDVFAQRVPFFERMGYRVTNPTAIHPDYGRVVVMRIDVRDAEHLARVRSPFFRHLKAAAPLAPELQVVA